MRLRGISTVEEANPFLEEYLPDHNQRFSVPPAKEVDLHREIPKGIDLDQIFSVRTKRALRNDFTIVHNKHLYQIETSLPQTRILNVEVEERLDVTMHITYNGQDLNYRKIEVRPLKLKDSKPQNPRKIHIPPPDHPWRKFKIHSFKNENPQREEKLSLVSKK